MCIIVRSMQSKNSLQLLNNIIGQLNGVKKMLEDDRPCVDVIPQLKASRSAISSLLNKYVSLNVEFCIAGLSKDSKADLSKLIKELSK